MLTFFKAGLYRIAPTPVAPFVFAPLSKTTVSKNLSPSLIVRIAHLFSVLTEPLPFAYFKSIAYTPSA